MARTRVSFATCNLYNLNQPGLSMYRDSNGWSEQEYNRKIEWTSGIISSLAADVWGFQELWHYKSFETVFDKAKARRSYELLVPKSHIGGKIVCAAAVRKDILVDGSTEWIEEFPEKFVLASKGEDKQTPKICVSKSGFSRPVLHFRVRPRKKSRPISIYVVHLKSKNETKIYRENWYRKDADYYRKHQEGIGMALSTIRRTAEAAALRMLLIDRYKDNDAPVVVLGDLNDGLQSNTLEIIAGEPNYLRAPWSNYGSDTDLYSVSAIQSLRSLRDVHYTYEHQNTRGTIDHILVSRELYDHSKNREWGFREMVVVNDHLDEEDHKATGSSDHGVVMAQFEYRPYKKGK